MNTRKFRIPAWIFVIVVIPLASQLMYPHLPVSEVLWFSVPVLILGIVYETIMYKQGKS